MADSRAGARNTQDKPGAYCNARKGESSQKSKHWRMSKRLRSQLKELQWPHLVDLGNKISNMLLDCDSKYEVNISKSILIEMTE